LKFFIIIDYLVDQFQKPREKPGEKSLRLFGDGDGKYYD